MAERPGLRRGAELRVAALVALALALALTSGASRAQEAPKGAVASPAMPDQAAPDQAVPDQAVPDQAAPDQAVPDQAAPDQAAPDQAAPDQAASGEAAARDEEAVSGTSTPAAPQARKGKAYGELSSEAPSASTVDPSQVGRSDVVLEATSLTPPQRRRAEKPSTRWSEVGGFVGIVNRNGRGDHFRYGVGIVYGGYFRPQITNWLGVRLYYRQESIPVEVREGAFDVGDTPDFDFSQSNLSVTSLGLRIEPTWNILPRVQLMGILGWGWMRFVAEMPSAPGFNQEADRSAVELNWGLGAGVGVDVVKNWVNLNIKGTYSLISNQTGDAYESNLQAIVDGRVQHVGTLERLGNPWDLLVSLGVIL